MQQELRQRSSFPVKVEGSNLSPLGPVQTLFKEAKAQAGRWDASSFCLARASCNQMQGPVLAAGA